MQIMKIVNCWKLPIQPIFQIYYTLNSVSLFWLAKSIEWIFEISPCDVMTADYTIIMSRTLKVTGNNEHGAWFFTGNHVKFMRFVVLAVSEEAKTWLSIYCFIQCIIKQLLDSVFVISRIINVLVRVISFSLGHWLITPTLTFIILDYYSWWLKRPRYLPLCHFKWPNFDPD